MSDGPIDIKLITTTKRGRIKVPATIQVTGGRIEFLKSPFALKDEIKSMQGARWHGFDPEHPRKIWSVKDSPRNHFQLRCMMGENPYEWFDQPLKTWTYARPLRDHQGDLANYALTYHYQIWAAEMGVGKGGLPSTKVATPSGWITLGEIQVGDEIINPDGGTTQIKGVFRRGKMKMFKVTFTDDSSVVCSGDHLWNVRTASRKFRELPYETLELYRLVDRGLQYANNNLKHYIPMVAPVEYAEAVLPVAPYLLGYILGNGSLSGWTNALTVPDQETCDRLNALMELPLQQKKNSEIDYHIKDKTVNEFILQSHLRGLRSPEKFLPDGYLYNSVANRVELLQGLCDSDGYAPENGGVEYSTTSPDLAEVFVALVQSLGGTCHVEEKWPTYTYKGKTLTGKLAYRIYASFSSDIIPFKLSRKLNNYTAPTKYQPTRAITRVESIGEDECICIAVEAENQLYVTDDFIVTHNTLAAIEVMEQSEKKNWWWVGPKKSLDNSIKREFNKWNLDPSVNVELISYEMMTKRMKTWEDGAPPPDGVVFDESSRLKSYHAQRTQAAQALADGIRDEYGFGGYVLLMSGTPSPKTPVDWWSQCLASDTWILTKTGPRQIKHLVNTPTQVRVRDQYYTTRGFYATGQKMLHTLTTEEGYSVRATLDHRFFEITKGWCELKDLKPGDKIELANTGNHSWDGEGNFNDGYALGFLIGDGYIYYKDGGLHTTLPIYGRKKQLVPQLLSCLPGEYTPTGDEPLRICHSYISKLARKFEFTPKKQITSNLEKNASSACLRGFLSGFFDTDGSMDYNRLRITLSQVSKERLLVVQRLLSYFGIRSKLQTKRRGPNVKPSKIDGRVIKTSPVLYILHITGEDAVRFHDRIGFMHPDKAQLLTKRLAARHCHVTPSYATINTIVEDQVEETYDAEVATAHCFAANGLLAHNCEITWPGFLREGNPESFEQRLAHMVLKEFPTGSFLKRVGWRDDENKCGDCGDYQDAPQHDSILCATPADFHKFVPGKNEVAYLEDRLKGLVVVKHKKDCLDLPDKQYRIVTCEPNATTLRVAKSLFDTAPSVITGLTALRELSDGFQYREKVDGTTKCPVCENGTTEVWQDPEEEDKIFEMIDMLDDEYIETLEKITVTCPTCNGTQEIPRKVRVTREVPTPKEAALVDLLEENDEQGRIVIFAGFTGSLDRIIRTCQKEGWNTVRCDGAGWRVEDCDGKKLSGKTDPMEYWSDTEQNGKVAFVAHPQSGGLSLTLTEARMSVFWSNDFNPESRSQAEDRIHRIGMDENKGATIVDLIHLPTDLNIRTVLKDNRRLELLSMGDIESVLG